MNKDAKNEILKKYFSLFSNISTAYGSFHLMEKETKSGYDGILKRRKTIMIEAYLNPVSISTKKITLWLWYQPWILHSVFGNHKNSSAWCWWAKYETSLLSPDKEWLFIYYYCSFLSCFFFQMMMFQCFLQMKTDFIWIVADSLFKYYFSCYYLKSIKTTNNYTIRTFKLFLSFLFSIKPSVPSSNRLLPFTIIIIILN